MLVQSEGGGGSKYYGLNILTRPKSFHAVTEGLEMFEATLFPKLSKCHLLLIICSVYAIKLILVGLRGRVNILWP